MPWQLYLSSGDNRVLASVYPHQRKLLAFWNHARSAADGLIHDWSTKDQWAFLGDWLTPHGSEPSVTPEAELFNNCYILYCTRIVANVSRVLGENDTVVQAYEEAATELAAAIHRKFFVPATNGYLDTRQTHLVMPLIAGAVPPEHTDGVWAALRKEILVTQGGHIDAGLHGNYFLTKLLTDTSMGFGEHDDLIHAYATQTTHPGWGDLLAKGFTTWPEAWGSGGPANAKQPWKIPACPPREPAAAAARIEDLVPDEASSSCWQSGALSPAHGTLNGIGQWFVQGIGGIRRAPGRVGYHRFELRPPWGLLPQVETATASFVVHGVGTIRSSWSSSAKVEIAVGSEAVAMQANIHVARFNVSVPPNTAATIFVPAGNVSDVKEGAVVASEAKGVRFLRVVPPVKTATGATRPQLAVYELDSGTFKFQSFY
jgi:alpha-L-rhamnosidase